MARLSLHALSLPSRRHTLELAARVSWQLERGFLPSVDDYQARQRIHGRGQTSGQADAGRIHRIDFSQSLIKRRVRYREDSIAPRRKVKVVVDLSMCDGSRSARRVLGTALLTSLSLCTLKSTSIVLKGTGGTRQFRDQPFGSASEIDLLIDTLADFELGAAGRISAGRLRFDLGDTTASSYFLITHYIEPDVLRQISCPLGMTCVMVEPSGGRIPGLEVGFFGGRFGGASSTLLGTEFDANADSMAAACRGRLGPLLQVRGEHDLAQAFLEGINSSRVGRARSSGKIQAFGRFWPFANRGASL